MRNQDIQQVFEAILQNYALPFGWQVAWPNVSINPDTPFCIPSLLPATTVSNSMQQTDRTWRGIFQILIVAPTGRGSQEFVNVADELAKLYEQNFLPNATTGVSGKLTVDGEEVYMPQCATVGAGYNGQMGYTIPVSVPYRADV